MATRREIFKELVSVAGECYPEVEARQIAEMIITSFGGITRNDLLIEPDKGLEITNLDTIFSDLRRWRPVQYIVGKAEFADMELIVREGVLIPRPETEELVEMILKDYGKVDDLQVLDIGTGSGCIAIALAFNLPFSIVTGIDISLKAIEIAKENAKRLKAHRASFYTGDIFTLMPEQDTLDIVVSNPPYIVHSEKADMEANVLDWEPSIALFVPDSDPLLFYRKIAELGLEMLVPGGSLYFEINRAYGAMMKSMLENMGYRYVELRKDMFGNDRMIKAIK